MSDLFKTLFANFSSKIWGALISFFITPYYIGIIGLEGYGLIGLYTTLIICLAPLDLGLGSTIKREMARLSVFKESNATCAHLTRTIEVIFWGMSLLFAITFLSLSSTVSRLWLPHTPHLGTEITFALMGLAIAMQWPLSFYTEGLIGLGKQIPLSLFSISLGTIGVCGSIIVLKYISPTIQAFFFWNAFFNLCQGVGLYLLMKKSLPPFEGKPKFDFQLLKALKSYALGMSGVAITAVILTQLDRILLSKILTLKDLGLYFLATTFSKALMLITGPIFTTYFPSLSQLVALNDEEGLKRRYHQGCQTLSMLVIPLSLMLIAFAPNIFSIWIGSETVTKEFLVIANVYTLGSLVNSFMTMPYALLTSFGRAKFLLYQNLLSILLLVPALIILTFQMGALGGALSWFTLNSGYLFLAAPCMHTKILPSELKRWYLHDLTLPFVIYASLIGIGYWLFPKQAPPTLQIVYLVALFIVSVLITLPIFPSVKKSLIKTIT